MYSDRSLIFRWGRTQRPFLQTYFYFIMNANGSKSLLNIRRFRFKLFKEIYPPMLTLKKENLSNLCATFLDLDISIVDGRLKCKHFDKRNAPEYKNKVKHIVRFPFRSSNMPSKMFHSTISAEILHICRATEAEDDFYKSATPFLSLIYTHKVHLKTKQGSA